MYATSLPLPSHLPDRAEAQRAAKQLVQLEKEREKYSLEASEANARYMQVRGGGGRGSIFDQA